jgi:hypothetical protein
VPSGVSQPLKTASSVGENRRWVSLDKGGQTSACSCRGFTPQLMHNVR